ncbi:MAG: hypothetical protein PHY93_17800 [Bacteriovorax sp.]|nr:hypothetical protein [Bacteriovorax sp.]
MDRNSSAFWSNQFKKFETSGLNKEKFCAREKLDRNLFHKWLKKIRPDLKGHRRSTNTTNATSSFISLKENSPEKILIKLSNGIELIFSTETSPRWIASFLSELEGARA